LTLVFVDLNPLAFVIRQLVELPEQGKYSIGRGIVH
jgi:hypothetical protein